MPGKRRPLFVAVGVIQWKMVSFFRDEPWAFHYVKRVAFGVSREPRFQHVCCILKTRAQGLFANSKVSPD